MQFLLKFWLWLRKWPSHGYRLSQTHDIAQTQRHHYYPDTPGIESVWLGLKAHWLDAHLAKRKKLTHQNQFSNFEGTPLKNNGQGKDWWLLKVLGISHQMVPECAWTCPFFQKFRGGCAPFEPLLIVRGGLAPPPLRYPRCYHFKGKGARKNSQFFYLGPMLLRTWNFLDIPLTETPGGPKAPTDHPVAVIEIWLSGPQRVNLDVKFFKKWLKRPIFGQISLFFFKNGNFGGFRSIVCYHCQRLTLWGPMVNAVFC